MKFSCFLSKSVLFLMLTGCGVGTKNMFSSFEKDDAGQDAAHEMENDRPEKAIIILEKALASNPTDYKLISLLSAAYAQKHGVELIDIALKLASGSKDSSSQDNGDGETEALTRIWPALPEASDANIQGINYAVDLLTSIPADDRSNADKFKLGLLSTVLASLQLKALDTNGDGKLSFQELLNLSEENAEVILAALLGAIGAMDFGTDVDASSQEAAEQISNVYTQINASSGESSAEQLQNYINANGTR